MQIADLLALGLAADQRAMTFAGITAAISAILTGLAGDVPVPMIKYLSTIGALIGAGVAVYSCSPKTLHIPGHRWESWEKHLQYDDKINDVLISQMIENDQRIKLTFSSLKRFADIFMVSLFILHTIFTTVSFFAR
jgi:hypothetical protein